PQRGGFRPSSAVMDAIGGPATGGAPLSPPDVPYYLETEDQATQRQLDEAKGYLEQFARSLRVGGQDVQKDVLIADDPKDAIVEHARKMHPTFIVLVRRTHPALAEAIFGSVASSVMKADIAPVLLVPLQNES
ncbi:MAG TPA: universal stress protein, partial [Dehalococcoidia bacterium]|nr:universal stress protein [Dehalococcoidia bacterium]